MSTLAGPSIRLLIVDEHTMFREGLARMLEGERDLFVVGQCASSTEAVTFLHDAEADVVLVDVDLGEERGLDVVVAAKRAGFQGRFLAVTAGVSEQEAMQLIDAGVAGVLHKQHSTEVLTNIIRRVASGESCLEKAYLGPLSRSMDQSRMSRPLRLTDRDRALLRCTLQGLTNRETAERMKLSESTVKASLRQVFTKLNVRTRGQAVKVALERYRDQL